MEEKFTFFCELGHFKVHRVGELVVITQNGNDIDCFAYGAENTPLRQHAQWKIEECDPLPKGDT